MTTTGPTSQAQFNKSVKAVKASSRAVAVKATVTDLGDVTVLEISDQEVQKAMVAAMPEEPVSAFDEKQLRSDVRSSLRTAMAQLSMPIFVPGFVQADELSTVRSLLKILKPIEAQEAEVSTRLGLPLDVKL